MKTIVKVILLLLTATASYGSASISRKIAAPFGGDSTMGIVDPTTRCGGVGTPLQTRISGCDGYCRLQPGTVYNCEKDFIPSSSSPSLSLMVEICTEAGFCINLFQVELENSSVQPGLVYTAKYSIVPNDILTGQTVQFRASLYQTRGSVVEVCVAAYVDIL